MSIDYDYKMVKWNGKDVSMTIAKYDDKIHFCRAIMHVDKHTFIGYARLFPDLPADFSEQDAINSAIDSLEENIKNNSDGEFVAYAKEDFEKAEKDVALSKNKQETAKSLIKMFNI